MNVLVIAPHPDDEVIGSGGSLCLHADAGDRITAVFLTSGELGLKHLPRDEAQRLREREAEKAGQILGLACIEFLRGPDWSIGAARKSLVRDIAALLVRERPSLIYLPHPDDGHPDHRASWPILRAALKRSEISRPKLRLYEVWTPLDAFGLVTDVTPVMPRKLHALRAHRSQLREFDYVRAVRGLNQFRGALAARCDYAEVFQTLSPKP